MPKILIAMLAWMLLLPVATLQALPLPRVHPASPWYQRVDQAALHPGSASMINTLSGLGGFGNSRLQIDFSIYVLHAGAGTATQPIIQIPPNRMTLTTCPTATR